MMLKRINMSAIAFSLAAVCAAAGWGQNAMAAESTGKADDMSGMDHSTDGGMSMEGMQGGSAPADARDPHAYSGGYGFRPTPRLVMADEYYMSGLFINRLERVQNSKGTFNAYDLQGFVGKDYDRLVVKAEGEVADGKINEARTELLWGHAIAAYWNTQLGIRNDSGELPGRNWLAFGVQGLAPYWFEIEPALFVSEDGDVSARLSATYDALLTQRLVLQPRLDVNVALQDAPEFGIGSGFNNVELGLRLRYEIRREIAPYVGVTWSRQLRATTNLARAGGETVDEVRFVAGVRLWW